MNKCFSLFLLSSVLVVACSRTDRTTVASKSDVELNLGASFTNTDTAAVEQTRATATAFEVGDRVGLYVTMVGQMVKAAGNVVDNLPLTVGLDGELNPATATYYPDPTAAVALAAYYPYVASVGDATRYRFEVSTDIEASDLCYARAEVLPSGERKLLGFRHLMSRVEFTFSLGSSFREVESVRLINVVTECTLDIGSGALTLGERDRSLAVSESKAVVVPPQTFKSGVQMVEVVVRTTQDVVQTLYYTPLSALSFDGSTAYALNLNVSNDRTVTLSVDPSVKPWTDGATMGVATKSVSNRFTLHSIIAHYRFAEVNRVVLTLRDDFSGVVVDVDAANVALVSGSSFTMASYVFDLDAVSGLTYPYTIRSVKLYRDVELIQETTLVGSWVAGSNVYRQGDVTLAFKILPILNISYTAPSVTIPKGGGTYYTDITSNTAWSATATNAMVTATGSGSVASFAIKVSATTQSATRAVSVVFTTIAGQVAVSRTWNGTQEALYPNGCLAVPLPGFPNTYVSAKDNVRTDWATATKNCAAEGGRLPTKDELVAMSGNYAYYGSTIRGYYWSSISAPTPVGNYYVVCLFDGDVSTYNGPSYAVRCVKDA